MINIKSMITITFLVLCFTTVESYAVKTSFLIQNTSNNDASLSSYDDKKVTIKSGKKCKIKNMSTRGLTIQLSNDTKLVANVDILEDKLYSSDNHIFIFHDDTIKLNSKTIYTKPREAFEESIESRINNFRQLTLPGIPLFAFWYHLA